MYHTTHFIDLALVYLLPFPRAALDILGVHLPLGQESNLLVLLAPSRFLELPIIAQSEAYNMHRVFDITVRTIFTLDVLVSEQTHLRVQVLPVCSQQASVQWDWWQ